MVKMSKKEISAKILKREKIKVFIIRITLEAFQLTARVRILAAILDFVEESEKHRKKIY